MVLNPQEIEDVQFQTSFRGYDKPEVRNYLRRLAREITNLQEELRPVAQLADSPTDEPPHPTDELPQAATEAEENPQDETPAHSEDAGESEADAQVADVQVSEADAQTEDGGEPEVRPDAAQDDVDDERFQALGDRIAQLLKAAHESARHLSQMAEVEVAEKMELAKTEGEAILANAEVEAASIREQAQREADEVRARAEADAERLKSGSELLHHEAEQVAAQAAEARENAVVEARAELERERQEAADLVAKAKQDHEIAMAELGDARSRVTDLLAEARSQSEFIKHEAEEVIRARVRRNMEQAEARLNILRNSEIASRERILAAQAELEGAMARLDLQEAPALPSNPERFAIDGANKRADVSDYGRVEADYGDLDEDGDEIAQASDSAMLEAPDGDLTAREAEKAESGEAEVIEVEVLEPAEDGDVVGSEEVSEVGIGGSDTDRPASEQPGFADPDLTPDLDEDSTEVEDEDALGRLVRQAMERAVDSARSSEV